MIIRDALDVLVARRALGADEAESVFEQLLAGSLDAAQVAAVLSLIQSRPVAVDELVGAARAMRRHVTRVPSDGVGGTLVDTCGTGGAPKAFNVSTLGAIVAVAAAPGTIRVAKHGNRSRTGRGSAELLASLGVNVDASPEVQARCLRGAGVCFSFAIHHHPAMTHAAPVRRALGFPTIFNLLGPLTNPAGARRQVIGVYARDLVAPVAHALAALGAERALVAHGEDGMDELTTTAPTFVAEIESGSVMERTIDASTLGLARAAPADLRARDLDDAVRMAREVLAGAPGCLSDIVALNAGAAVYIGGAAPTLGDGVDRARAALKSGAGAATLERLVTESNRTT